MDDRQATPNEYAADKTELAADDLAHDAANVAASGAKNGGATGPEAVSAPAGEVGGRKAPREYGPR